jgi:hypothetical protein
LAFAVAVFVTGSFVGTSSAMAAANGPTYQQWVNRGSGLCLTVTGSNGTSVIQAVCATPGSTPMAQQWLVYCLDTACDQQALLNRQNQLCLFNGSSANGSPVIPEGCVASASSEAWRLFVPAGNPNGDVSLRSLVLGTNTSCLDVPGASTAQGVALQIWTCNGTVAQRFFARNA